VNEKSNDPMGIEPATFWLATMYLTMRHQLFTDLKKAYDLFRMWFCGIFS